MIASHFAGFVRRYLYLSVAMSSRKLSISRTLTISTCDSFALSLNAVAQIILIQKSLAVPVLRGIESCIFGRLEVPVGRGIESCISGMLGVPVRRGEVARFEMADTLANRRCFWISPIAGRAGLMAGVVRELFGIRRTRR